MFQALIVLVLAAPLPLGAYPDWAWPILAAASGTLVFCWGASTLAGRGPMVLPPRFLLWSATALVLAVLWALLQAVGFTPQAWHHPIWRDTAAALDAPYRGAVSLDPVASLESVLRMGAYGGMFWLAFQYGRDRERARCAIRAVAAGTACYAAYGLVVAFSGADLILWFEKTAYRDAVTATFVNPNSFGTYCGIGLLCATAALHRPFDRGRSGTGLRLRVHFLVTEFAPRHVAMLAAWLLVAAALLLSLSRGAIMATCLASLVYACAMAVRRGVRTRTLLLRSVAFMLVGGTLVLLAGEGFERRLWETGPDWAKRAEIYSQTVNAIAERPVSGTGLGTFESVYRSGRVEGIRPGVRMAHNDYLELALELGIPAAVLLVSALVVLALGCARGVRARSRDAAVPAAGLSACVLVGAHAFVDFSLQIPAVAATFAVVLGVAVAQATPSLRRPGPVRRAVWSDTV